MSEKFIKQFEINIGSFTKGSEPFITIIINDRQCTVSLKDLRDWINTIYDSKGDRSEKAYKAFDNFKAFIAEPLCRFFDYEEMRKKNISIEEVADELGFTEEDKKEVGL